MMRRLFGVGLFVCVGLTVGQCASTIVRAQGASSYRAIEQLTIDNTAGGIALTGSKITPVGDLQATLATCTLETADIRYTVDGTAPTSTVGMYWTAGSSLSFATHDALLAFRAIRVTSTSGKLDCTYSALSVATALGPINGAGGGGGGGGATTIQDPTTPTQKAAVNASGQLSITCANCSGSGASGVDESAFTQGVNSVAPAGVLFKTSYTALSSGQLGIMRGFSDGSLFSMGNTASGATDAGNPLKIGGVFNTTQPTVTNGQRVDAQMSARGGQIVSSGADTFHVTVDTAPSTAVTNAGTFSVQATNAGTFAVQAAESGAWNITNVSGTVSLPTLASTSTKQSDGTQKTQIVDGSNNVVGSTGNAIDVNIKSGGGSGGTALADNATFTYSTTSETPVGCVYNSSITNITSGKSGAVACDATRNQFHVIRDAAGNARGANVNGSNQLSVTVDNIPAVTESGTWSVRGQDGSGNALTSTANALDVNIKSGGSATDANSYAIVVQEATATATGAALECQIVSAASTNSTNCKASAGNWYGFDIINTTATVYYLRLYNTATGPTCSSATGFIRSIPIPSNATSGGGIVRIADLPVNYGTGISYCLTGGSGSTDNTNAAVGIFGALLYK